MRSEKQADMRNDGEPCESVTGRSYLADYEAYSHVFRAAAELRQAARGRPWSEIDSDVPERPERLRAPRGDTQTQASDRRRESLTPTRRQRHRRGRSRSAYTARESTSRRFRGSSGRKCPSIGRISYRAPPQPEHGHGPRIGW